MTKNVTKPITKKLYKLNDNINLHRYLLWRYNYYATYNQSYYFLIISYNVVSIWNGV